MVPRIGRQQARIATAIERVQDAIGFRAGSIEVRDPRSIAISAPSPSDGAGHDLEIVSQTLGRVCPTVPGPHQINEAGFRSINSAKHFCLPRAERGYGEVTPRGLHLMQRMIDGRGNAGINH
jgi:hypothetical protein